MKGAISWGGGLDQLSNQLTGLHTAQADIALGGHSFPRYGSMQKPLGPAQLNDSIDYATSRLAALSDPHGLDALQGTEAAHLSRNSSDEHLAAYAARGSTQSLPTVAEDDIFSAVGGLELGLDAHQHHPFREAHQHASALPDQHNGDASRTLIIRNVAPEVADEELRSIFQAFGDVRHLHSALKPQGIIVVTYFDLRAATNAVSTLDGTLIQGIPISVACAGGNDKELSSVNQGTMMFHDSENTNNHLVWLFSKFGAVKGIWEAPNRPSQKFITFYDVRHAAAALRAMNRSAESLNKMPGQLTAQQVAALQPSISAPNLLQLGQLSSQLAASESQGNRLSGLWDNSPSSSAVESLMQLAKQHNQPQRMSQVHSHQNLGSAALATADAPSPASLLASASRHGSQHDLQALQDLQQQSQQASSLSLQPPQSPQQQQQQQQQAEGADRSAQSSLNAAAPHYTGFSNSGMEALAASMGGMHVNPYNMPGSSVGGGGAAAAGRQHAARRGSPMAGYPPRPGSAQGMMGGLMAGYSGLPMMSMYGAAGLDPMSMLAAGYDCGMGLDGWMPPGGMAYGAGGMGGMPYPPFPPAGYPPPPSGSGGMATPPPLPDLPAGHHALLLQQQAQLYAQLQAQQALMMGRKDAGSPAALQAAMAQFLQQQGMMAGAGMMAGMLPPQATAAAMGGVGGPPGSGMAAAQQGGFGMGGGGGGGPRGGGMGGRGHGHGHGGAGVAEGSGGAGGRSGGRLSRRTTDPQAELERKAQQEKLYALHPEKIQRGEDRRTTLMIKNIPNKYTQKMLLATVDEQFKGTYDFFYLPIDFKNKCNVGYAFINMVQPVDIIPFMQRFNSRKWERFNSEKVCSISYARIQGRAALVQHFQNSSLMHEDKRCRPILFTVEDNATVAGEQEAFPTPSHSGTSSTGAATATEPRSLSTSANNSHTKLSSLPGGGSASNLVAMATVGGSGGGGSAAGAAGPNSHGGGGSTSSSSSVVAKAASALAAAAASPAKAQA